MDSVGPNATTIDLLGKTTALEEADAYQTTEDED